MRPSAWLRVALVVGLLGGFGVAAALPAGSLTLPGTSVNFNPLGPGTPGPAICTGTDAAPGQLAGIYPSGVVVWGTCWVNGGLAQVEGNLTVEPGSTLNASFARNDQAQGVGQSALEVSGDINVYEGGTLILGCEPKASPCTDDPAAANGGTLASMDVVGGSVVASDALGVIIHHSIIGGDVTQIGGGGGLSCQPPASGPFAAMHTPVFSGLEDNWIVGSVTLAGLQTCWDGALRNYVGGDFTNVGNVFADPDANEVLSNVVQGDLACASNSPVVQYGDSHASPNLVAANATGECSFSTYQPDPPGPPMPVSVPG